MKLINVKGDSILKLKHGVVQINNGVAFIGTQEVNINYSDLELSETPTVLVTMLNPSVYAKNDTRVYAQNVTKNGCTLCANHVNQAFGGSCKIGYLVIGK